MANVEVIKASRTLTDRSKKHSLDLLRVCAYCRVSTDSEDQLNSYKSQVSYYTDLIQKNTDWVMVDVYADEAITGTQVTKRADFQRLINDCMDGSIDMIITKSISRFARNTLDTLKYVRMLKEKNIAVFFEDEKINTLTMDGELLLVVLSSVAQQEVENISANVKKGLKMKMGRGELVGFHGCLGYDYDKKTKSITINEEEAEIVRYIFSRYVEGAGGSMIGNELKKLGHKTKRNNSNWAETTVLGIIKNEKYKGDILLGKTFTVDPISKRRLDNFGEEDQFYLKDHHEPIISEEIFNMAQEIRVKRSIPRGLHKDGDFKRQKYSRKFAFSSMLKCGFCGSTLTRRRWHSGSQYDKVIWQCVTSTKKGKKYCPNSKGITEKCIEDAFIESYRQLCNGNKDILETFLKRLELMLSEESVEKEFSKLEKNILLINQKKNKLIDLQLDGVIDKISYEQKYSELTLKGDKLAQEKIILDESYQNEKGVKKRLIEFRNTLGRSDMLNEFDRNVFESIVEKVLIGHTKTDGTIDPYKITFIYKTGLKSEQNGRDFKPKRMNSRSDDDSDESSPDLCSQASDEGADLYSHHCDHTCGDGNVATSEIRLEIVSFRHFFKHVVFTSEGDKIQSILSLILPLENKR